MWVDGDAMNSDDILKDLREKMKSEAVRKPEGIAYYVEIIKGLHDEKKFTFQEISEWLKRQGITCSKAYAHSLYAKNSPQTKKDRLKVSNIQVVTSSPSMAGQSITKTAPSKFEDLMTAPGVPALRDDDEFDPFAPGINPEKQTLPPKKN